jgi:hypothetical protein
VLALAGFLGLSYTGVVVNVQVRTSNDPSPQVASLGDLIPSDQPLVSFGHVHHLFAYYYAKPIEFKPLDAQGRPVDDTATYFCFSLDPGFVAPTISFPWEMLAEVSCDRARSEHPRARVIVGKRVMAAAVANRKIDPTADAVSPTSFVEPAAAPPARRQGPTRDD